MRIISQIKPNYLHLFSVINGKVAVDFDFSGMPQTLMSSTRIDDGYDQSIGLMIAEDEIILAINDYVEDTKGIFLQALPTGTIHVGGTRNVYQDTGSKYSNKFYGCLKSVEIRVSNLPLQTTAGVDILPIPTTAGVVFLPI